MTTVTNAPKTADVAIAATLGYLVGMAKDETHPLHGAFVWDDAEAARLYRLDQARRLINAHEAQGLVRYERFGTPA
jgi:hypothetical protein